MFKYQKGGGELKLLFLKLTSNIMMSFLLFSSAKGRQKCLSMTTDGRKKIIFWTKEGWGLTSHLFACHTFQQLLTQHLVLSLQDFRILNLTLEHLSCDKKSGKQILKLQYATIQKNIWLLKSKLFFYGQLHNNFHNIHRHSNTCL